MARQLEVSKSPVHRGLTVGERRFVSEYMIDMDSTEAAIRAGYPRRSAAGTGGWLMGRRDIQLAIDHETELLQRRSRVDQDWVMERLKAVADAKVTDVLSWKTDVVRVDDDVETEDGEPVLQTRLQISVRDSADIPEEMLHAIASIEQSKDGSFKFKMHDKLAALDRIGKQVGMFKNETVHTGKVDVNVVEHDVKDVAKALAAIIAKGKLRTIEHDPDEGKGE